MYKNVINSKRKKQHSVTSKRLTQEDCFIFKWGLGGLVQRWMSRKRSFTWNIKPRNKPFHFSQVGVPDKEVLNNEYIFIEWYAKNHWANVEWTTVCMYNN